MFLEILAAARMVIWTTQKKGLYDDANFSYRDLVLYFRHQLGFNAVKGRSIRDNLHLTLWKDKVTLQKVGVTSWKDRNVKNMNRTTKEKCSQSVCSGEGEYITHHTCSNGNNLDMYLATMCDCGREFNSLRG